MSNVWDPDCPSLQRTLVCYADILGFRAKTRDAFKANTAMEISSDNQAFPRCGLQKINGRGETG